MHVQNDCKSKTNNQSTLSVNEYFNNFIVRSSGPRFNTLYMLAILTEEWYASLFYLLASDSILKWFINIFDF